jgi:hypothetical protein
MRSFLFGFVTKRCLGSCLYIYGFDLLRFAALCVCVWENSVQIPENMTIDTRNKADRGKYNASDMNLSSDQHIVV